MTTAFTAEILLGALASIPPRDALPLIVADLDTTQTVDNATATRHGVTVRFWAANRSEARAALARATRAMGAPAEFTLR